MNFVKHITANVKGGVDLDLSERVYLLGPNSIGKSRVINAVELACSGAASDIQGRELVADEGLLSTLGPADAGLFAEALLSNGDKLSWGIPEGKKRGVWIPNVKSGAMYARDAIFPLRAVRDAIRGNAETARKFFLQYAVGSSIEKEDIFARTADIHHVRLEELWTAVKSGTGAEKLLAVLEKAKERSRMYAATAESYRRTVTNASVGLAGEPTLADADAAREAMEKAKKDFQAAVATGAKYAQHQEAAARIEQLNKEAERCADRELEMARKLKEAERALALCPAPLAMPAELFQLTDLIKWHVKEGKKKCQCCGRPLALGVDASFDQGLGGVDFSADMTARLKEVEEWRRRVDAASKEYRDHQAMVESAKNDLHAAEQDFKKADAAYRAAKEALGDAPDAAPDLASFKSALDGAELTYSKVNAARVAWLTVRTARDSAASCERDAGEWKALAEELARVVGSLLDTAVATFAASVQAHLPPTDRFTLKLRDGEKEICQYGLLIEDDRPYTALGGVEWARVTAALAGACARGPLSIIVPEDRSFDRKRLTEVMAALGKAPCQILMAGAVEPESVPEGWRVLEVGAAQPVKRADPFGEDADLLPPGIVAQRREYAAPAASRRKRQRERNE